MIRIVFSALAMCAVLTSSSAFATSNCEECLGYWNLDLHEVWSCSNPNNPSNGEYAIITDLHFVYEQNVPQCWDSQWCVAACGNTYGN